MGDTSVFQFHFGLEPSLAPGAVEALAAIARGERPAAGDLAALPLDAREALLARRSAHVLRAAQLGG